MTNQIYLVINGTREQYVAERNLSDMTRERTIEQIAAGEWLNISSVIELGDKDVTTEFAVEVMEIWARRGESLTNWQRDFIERHIGIRAARAFELEAAE